MSTYIDDVHVFLCQSLKAYPVVVYSDDDILDVIIVFVINQCLEVITIDWKSLDVTLHTCSTFLVLCHAWSLFSFITLHKCRLRLGLDRGGSRTQRHHGISGLVALEPLPSGASLRMVTVPGGWPPSSCRMDSTSPDVML